MEQDTQDREPRWWQTALWTLELWSLWFKPRVLQRRFKRWHDRQFPDRKFCMELGCWDRQFRSWPTCREHHSCGLKAAPCCGWCPTLSELEPAVKAIES